MMSFDYNTQRKRMSLPEYGRNVQKMIEHVKNIKDPEERNRAARTIIQIMGNLNPNLRDVTDFKHKLWDHLMIIANFDLDVDSPYPAPDILKMVEKPNRVPYHSGQIRYMHYGRIVESLIDYASALEEGDERDYLTSLILNQMKKDYLTWNKGLVTDEVIIRDLVSMSKGKLSVNDNVKILEAKDLLSQQRTKPSGSRYSGRKPDKHQGRQGKPMGKKNYKSNH
jgi:hypothetical protein